jgi:phosphoribosylanthranilate isomerase
MALPRLLLIDAARGGQYGGTGATLDWTQVAAQRPQLGGMPLVLAGGLTPDNVACAIAQLRPWAVDVASGVESAPGVKSAELVQMFVDAARGALRQAARR